MRMTLSIMLLFIGLTVCAVDLGNDDLQLIDAELVHVPMIAVDAAAGSDASDVALTSDRSDVLSNTNPQKAINTVTRRLVEPLPGINRAEYFSYNRNPSKSFRASLFRPHEISRVICYS